MLTRRGAPDRSQIWITIALFIGGVILAREIGSEIVAENTNFLQLAVIGVVLCATAVAILRNWRLGFYLFNIWLLFEDLLRKYMGNGLIFFFGKDVLALIVYIALFLAIRRGREERFKPPFLLWFPLVCFMWLAILQIFNPNSPSVLYGLLGFKLDFFYIPMMYVGYAFIRNSEDLRKFLVLNAVLAIVIAGIGIIQGVVGNTFLNPQTLAPDIAELGNLEKVTPISGQVFSLPPSVFVSTSRFGLYLAMAATFAIGTAGYLLLYSKRSRLVVFTSLGFIGAATVLSGSRTAVVDVVSTSCVLTVGLLWGAPWRWGQAHRMVKAIRWGVTITGLALALALLLFPQAVGSRIAFYSETLNPTSTASAVNDRGWTYPIDNLLQVFDNPHWVMGNGLGTASLGTQYVARFRGTGLLTNWTEEGYGEMILEMGILAPFLWLLWTGCLMWCAWKIVRRMRQTAYSPISFAIVWYAFVLLYPLTYQGTNAFQNYINNVFLWLMVGVLFRLPVLQPAQERTEVVTRQVHRLVRRWRFRPHPVPIGMPETAPE